jgi:hypothetical protein
MRTKLVIESGGQVVEWEIGHGSVSSLIGYDFPTPPPEHPLIDLLSQHPSSAVRKQVAESFELSDEVLRRLESDSVLAVREGLVNGQSTTRARLSKAFLSQVIEQSVEAAEKVAWSITDFEEAESPEIVRALLEHPDPAVRKCAAQHELGTKSDRKKLKADSDVDVRRAVS